MEKDSKTTVAVERTTFAKLDRLAKANSVSKMEYITHAINYFEKYGINPVEHESPAQEMQKLIKRMDQVFAFLKKQETDLVRPACEALAGASTQITISLSSLLSEESPRVYIKHYLVSPFYVVYRCDDCTCCFYGLVYFGMNPAKGKYLFSQVQSFF
jgi:hypothetical protein